MLNLANVDPVFFKALILKPPTIHNGPKARRFPWPRRRHFDKREKKAVIQLLDKEICRGGAVVYEGVEEKAYCDAFAKFLGGGYADAVNSGTNALYIALRALGLEPGSEVVVPPVTDTGGVMPVPLINCIPIPADSAPGQLNTSAEQVEKVLTPKTAAIIIAHIAGYPVDMDPILELATARGIPIIEDCAQAHGAKYKGRMVGTFGRIAAFSTMFGKHHCTGAQGGVVFTKDTLLFLRARQLADRGKPFGVLGNPGNLVASLNFNQNEIGMAIGRVQLDKLPRFIKARRDFAERVAAGLKNTDGVTFIGDSPDCESSYLFLMIQLQRPTILCSAAEFASALSAEGIDSVSAGYPFYPTDMPWYRDAVVYGKSGLPWSAPGHSVKPPHFDLRNAHQANQDIIRVDIHESLGSREARDLARAIRKLAAYFSYKREQ
jgi:dTDP-4-amino-4,6-dideoxygalactose transaminase